MSPADEILTLLSTPPSKPITVQPVPFSETLPEYDGFYAVVLDNVLSPAECEALIGAAEATSADGKWEPALVNVGFNKQRMMKDVRDCGRIIWDDKAVVDAILKRVRPFILEIEKLKNWPRVQGQSSAKRGEVWQLTRLNERMRFLRYGPGQYFREHCDGAYITPSGGERSHVTLHLYLNDSTTSTAGKLKGGATTFHSTRTNKLKMDIEPKVGRVLIFQHLGLLHSGEEVQRGLKMTMRTDLMYEKL